MRQKECRRMKRFLVILVLVTVCVASVWAANWIYAPKMFLVIEGADMYIRSQVYPELEKIKVKPYLQFDPKQINKKGYLTSQDLMFLLGEEWRLNELNLETLDNYTNIGTFDYSYDLAKSFVNFLVRYKKVGYLGVDQLGGNYACHTTETIVNICKYARSKKCM